MEPRREGVPMACDALSLLCEGSVLDEPRLVVDDFENIICSRIMLSLRLERRH